MCNLTKAQQIALHRQWLRFDQGMSYRAFRRTVQPMISDRCVMVKWCGMWLGIETDGYTHS